MPIQTATNPKTGARLAFVDDQWKPIEQSATNPQGLKAYKIGGSWLTDDGPSLPEVEVIAAPGIGEIPGQRLTRAQEIYRSARPYIAPLVEAGGAMVGGIYGAGAGTLASPTVIINPVTGAMMGSGLGYGIAKEGLELADVAMGMKAPRRGEEQITTPLANIVEGGAYELGGQALGKSVGYGVGKIIDVTKIPKIKAAQIARDALGPDLQLATNMLAETNKKGLSAAQATADINSPAWQALLDRASKRDPRFRAALLESEGEFSLNALAKLAGGTTAAETRATTEQAKKALNAMTTPQREEALNLANLGKEVAKYEAQAGKLSAEAAAEVQKVRSLISAGNAAEAWARLDLVKRNLPVAATKYTYAGELAKKADEWASNAANASLDLGQGARFAQSAADTLRFNGIKPLESASLIRNINSLKSNPEFAGNDIVEGAINTLAKDIAKWTSSGGIIDAKALDAIRKNSVNAAIQELRPGMDATAQRNLAAGVMSDIKPLLIDAIEAAGGRGYRQYLENYTKGMQQIAETRLSGEALRLWKQPNKDAFVNLVLNESPETVEKFLGKGNYNIGMELTESTLATLKAEADKVIRDAKITTQVSGGQDALKQLLLENTSKLRLPSYLSAVAASTNKALSILENKIGNKTMQYLTEASKSPENAKHLLDTLPASERIRVLNLLTDPKQWSVAAQAAKSISTGALISGANALAPEQYNSNALAPENQNNLRAR